MQDCSICLEPLKDLKVCGNMNCKHLYHCDCIDTWIKTSDVYGDFSNKKCPICRAPLNVFEADDTRRFDFGKSASVKVIHFGASGMSDFTKNLDIQRRNRYIKRHIKDLRTNNPIRAGYLSMFVLWNKKSLSSGIKDYRKRLSIYNSTGKFPKKILQK